MKIFCERLLALRKEYGYTQRQVAQMLGISQPSYIRYENGTAQPSLESLSALADIFDVSADYLIGRRNY